MPKEKNTQTFNASDLQRHKKCCGRDLKSMIRSNIYLISMYSTAQK